MSSTDGTELYSTITDVALVDLVETFVADLPERMAAINDAIAAQDFETLRTLAHQLKGSAGGYGFPDISQFAWQLESGAKAQEDWGTLNGTWRALADLCNRARAVQTAN